MDVKIITSKISKEELAQYAKEQYVEMIKGAIDIGKGSMALGGEWHMDANQVLIDNGSEQKDIWGFNIYVDKNHDERVEYISLINIRPAQNNRSMEIEDGTIREKMKKVIDLLVE